MTSEHAKQVLTDWLGDQPNTAPGGLLNTVLAGVDETAQRGRWMAAVTSVPMFSPFALQVYVGAAAVTLSVAIGLGVLNGSFNFGPGPVPQPSATVSPTPTPTADVPSPATLRSNQPASVPSALPTTTASPTLKPLVWVPWQLTTPGFFISATIQRPQLDYNSPVQWGINQVGSTMAAVYSDASVTYDTFNLSPGAAPYVDPCAAAAERKTVKVGPSVDDLVSALKKIPVIVSPVTDTQVAGYPAKSLTFTAPAVQAGCENGEFQLWQWPAPFSEAAPVGPMGKTTVYVLDVHGTRVLVTVEDRGTPADSALLQHMLDTLVLGSSSTN